MQKGQESEGVSALEPNSIHIDFTLQYTSYETGSIHFDHVHTTNLTRCDYARPVICSRDRPCLL